MLGLPAGSLQAGIVDAALAVDLSSEEREADGADDGGGVSGGDWGVVPDGLLDLPFEGE